LYSAVDEVGGADRDPAHPAGSDVVADLEAEGVAIEARDASGSSCGRKVPSMMMSTAVMLGAAP
jgi:hypothetical protein